MNLLFLTLLFPLLGYFALAFARGRIGERSAAIIGVGSVGLSALVAAYAGTCFLISPPPGGAYTELLWQWMQVGDFKVDLSLRLDSLSLVMLWVVTGVSFLIHVFSVWYMHGEEGFARFFAYMNLFVASMLFLVLADDLMFLYLGWEGVGLCSYLLIGFNYKDPANGSAARKAFVVTRIGDTLMLIGMWIIIRDLGTLNIQQVLELARVRSPSPWSASC